VTAPLPEDGVLARVVADADEELAGDLEEVARLELVSLWSDLADARRYAVNGVWSMGCEGVVHRIVLLTRLVGPASWENIGPELLEDGLYRAVHAAMGVDPGVDEAACAEFLDRVRAERARWTTGS
jgi:hypothetical protein